MSVEYRCDKCGKVIPPRVHFVRSVDVMDLLSEPTRVVFSAKLDLCQGCRQLFDVQARELLAKTQVRA